MPPSLIPHHLMAPHHQLHHAPSRESRRELNSSSSSAFLYSTAHLSSGVSAKDAAAATARDLKRHRSSTLQESPPPSDSKATGRISTSSSKIPPTPAKKPSLLQKKPAAVPLYIKTSTSRTTTSSSQARPPSAVPTTPTTVTSPNAVRSPTSFSTLASPTSPPLKRKQPARFSSNGISTSAGPPPSLAYRKTNGMEQQRNYTPQTPTTTRTREISSTPITIRGGGGVQHSERMEVDDDERDQDRTIRGLEDIPRHIDSRRDEEDDEEDIAMTDYDSNKDLFLSLAKAEPPKVGINASKRTQDRQLQSRIAQRSSMPPPARPVSHSDASDVSPLTTFPTNRKSVPVPMVDALAEAMEHGPRDATSRGLSYLKRESSAGIERVASPERGSTNKFGALNYNPTAKTLNPSPLQQDRTIASMLEQDKLERANSVAGDTASTVSTNAASVWDELEELKSRIHKLEVTGNTVGFGKGSDSSGGRPRTATTTATTLSSSPRNNNVSGQSPSASMVGNSVHPLLHQALSRTKQLIDPEVYKALEATAKDAFALVDIVGSNGTSGAVASPPSTSGGMDRQVRRKVDSLCRSLTELSLVLSEASHGHPQIPAAPPVSNQTPSGSFTSVDSYGSQRSHLSSLGRPMTREGGLESRLEERSAAGLGLRGGRDSVLSDRKLLSRRMEIVDTPRRPSMQNLATPSTLQGLQQSVSYSDITRRAAPGSAAGIDAALKLERAKAQRAEAMGRNMPEPLSRDGQIDHIMHDLEMQESAYRTPSRATTEMLRASRRRAEERDREIEQLTNELSTSRRPNIYHNRTSSSATVTQSSVAGITQRNSPLSLSQPSVSSASRNSPLSSRRSLDREREDGANISSMDRMARRSLLTRSMQEQPTQPLSPVDAGRRFFDERETRERDRTQRNTIHVEGGYASVAAAALAQGRREGGYSALELKRKSHSGAVTGTPGRMLRSAGAGGMDYEESAGIEAAMEKERERLGTREGEGRRFLRRRME